MRFDDFISNEEACHDCLHTRIIVRAFDYPIHQSEQGHKNITIESVTFYNCEFCGLIVERGRFVMSKDDYPLHTSEFSWERLRILQQISDIS